jgi:hypothetical protein
MTTTSREPNCDAANSIDPITEGATMLSATRTTNRSPKPASNKISTGVLESEQPRMIAKRALGFSGKLSAPPARRRRAARLPETTVTIDQSL